MLAVAAGVAAGAGALWQLPFPSSSSLHQLPSVDVASFQDCTGVDQDSRASAQPKSSMPHQDGTSEGVEDILEHRMGVHTFVPSLLDGI